MSEAKLKHTPGPWSWAWKEGGGYDGMTDAAHVFDSAGEIEFSPLCVLDAREYGQENLEDCPADVREMVEANASLIAAAPDLLEACALLMKAEDMQKGARGGAIMGEISIAIDAARVAIREATGETDE